jgi:hypothetical protein
MRHSIWSPEVFNPQFVKANLSGARVLAMSLSSDYESEEDTRLLAENFGAVRMLDKAKLCDELIPVFCKRRIEPSHRGI